MRTCQTCGCEIDAERLEALPDTMTCTAHSTAQKVVGFTVSYFAKGTGSELAIIRDGDPEAKRLAERANKRRR